MVLSQPLYRDSLINGKFLAGLTTIAIIIGSIVIIISGIGYRMIGVMPEPAEIVRIVIFFLICLLYVAFWLGLAILFSVLFRRAITSIMSAISVWLVFTLFITMIAGLTAEWVAPVTDESSTEAVLEHQRVEDTTMRVSPTTLFNEATETVLNPGIRTLRGLVLVREVQGMIAGPLSLGQSLILVWLHLVSLFTLTAICFAISYIKFMREEIRSTLGYIKCRYISKCYRVDLRP